MLTQYQLEKLELYHNGKLSENERKEVENTILENPDLKTEAEGLLELYKGFNGIQLENFENQLNEWEQECAKEVEKPIQKEAKVLSIGSFVSSYRFAAAAVILVLFLPLAYILFQNLGPGKGEKLFASNAEHYTAIQLNTRSGSDEAADPLQAIKEKAIVFYNDKKYDQALNQLNAYYSKSDEKYKTTEIKLYLALSHLFSGNNKEAITYFSEILTKENSGNYREAAEWYLALSYLKDMNVEKSTELLKKISETENHPYQSKAVSLLPELKTLKQ
jgi:tetratricopeptide (TPR) repeat protein